MVAVGSRQKGAVGVASITYSSQVLPASRISAKRQLAMLKDSYGTMVTAVAIVLRRQGFMAEEHDGNILLSCGGRLYAALHFLRLELQGRQVVALQPSADVTYFLPAPVIEDAWEQQGDAWVRSSASAVFGDDIGVQVGPISSAASKKPPMSATDLHDLVVRASDCAQRRARDSQSTNRERGIRGVPPAAGCDTRGPAPVSESTAALTSSSTGCEYGTGG